MASYIKRGESLFIPFKNGESIYDSQLKPRMYKTKDLYDRFSYHFAGAEMVEYVEVVRCKNCKHWNKQDNIFSGCRCVNWKGILDYTKADDFCSCGERKGDGE